MVGRRGPAPGAQEGVRAAKRARSVARRVGRARVWSQKENSRNSSSECWIGRDNGQEQWLVVAAKRPVCQQVPRRRMNAKGASSDRLGLHGTLRQI